MGLDMFLDARLHVDSDDIVDLTKASTEAQHEQSHQSRQFNSKLGTGVRQTRSTTGSLKMFKTAKMIVVSIV